MKIAITSGKGGVGKTFVATCLADFLQHSQKVSYIDCDVEAPNAHLFFKSDIVRSTDQTLECVVSMDPSKCTHCGLCVKACSFNALLVGKNNAIAFPELCRSCGACKIVCPHDALVTGTRTIGTIYNSDITNIDLNWATLQTGAGGMTVPLIDRIKRSPKNDLVILDSPPGTSCPVVATIKDSDVVILVADPTRFGRHDLKLSVHLCRSLNITPFVVVNRSGIGDTDELIEWCDSQNIEILAQIPDDRKIAELYSQGLIASRFLDHIEDIFARMSDGILSLPYHISNQNNISPAASGDDRLFFDAEQTTSAATNNNNDNSKTGGKPVPLNEITVVSGKGGTGKTSISACFAQLNRTVITDCDVDAADMHLLCSPEILESGNYSGGQVYSIDPNKCTLCGRCIDVCHWSAISQTDSVVSVAPDRCEGCGACKLACPADAISQHPTDDGKWYFSSTRFGGLSHATLEPGRENSGKLVTLLRKNTAEKSGLTENTTVVLDGSPGTGCPVIASIGGAGAAVIVTEPTVSGLHDLKRIFELTAHFKIPAGVIINKSDINPEVCEQIVEYTNSNGALLFGKLPYDTVFIDAQQSAETLLEHAPDHPISKEIESIWNKIITMVHETEKAANER